MSLESKISIDANSSSPEVKERAKQDVDNDNQRYRSEKLDNDIKEQDKEERRLYAYRVFTLICIWLLCVVLILIAQGHGNLYYSDTIIVTLLTTTTANIIGLFAIVNGYLFKTENNNKKKNNQMRKK